ncbi:MAG: hypothetical protein U5L96_07135 [Owenweeksia sp.]|nr:hypothetical protein [Owenweeksia sp.]
MAPIMKPLTSANGCDSIRITDLTVLPTAMSNKSSTICDGDSILLAGMWQSMRWYLL